MERKRRIKVILRCSLGITTLVAIYWSMYFLIMGNVPYIENPMIFVDYNLPLKISRWWDIIAVFSSSVLILWFSTRKDIADNLKDYTFHGSLVFLCSIIAVGYVRDEADPKKIEMIFLSTTLFLVLAILINLFIAPFLPEKEKNQIGLSIINFTIALVIFFFLPLISYSFDSP